MEYAKLLQKSAGRFDYRESPLKTVMKVNELKKTINKDGRANIIRQEPYANRIEKFLTKEELKRQTNEGARQYLAAVQQQSNDLKLNFINQTPDNQEQYLKEARKQQEFMKILKDPSRYDYLSKVDPFGLYVLKMEQEEDNAKLQQQMREQQINQNIKKTVNPETYEQSGHITLNDLAQAANTLRVPKVSMAGSNILINTTPMSSKKKAIDILAETYPEIRTLYNDNPSMTAKQIVQLYNTYMLQNIPAPAPIVPAPAPAPAKAKAKGKAKGKGVVGIKAKDSINTVKSKAVAQNIVLGQGFKPKSSRKKIPNQNEYNREQAHHLIQNAIQGEGFFGDLKDKLGLWLWKNVHPMGRMIEYAKNK